MRHVAAVLAAALAVLSSTTFAPAFSHTGSVTEPRFVLPVAGAVVVVTVTALVLSAWTRMLPVNRLATECGVLACYVALVVAPGWDVAAGPRRLLTTALPIEPAGPEYATVVALAGLAAVGGVEPALRRPWPLVPMLAPLVLLVSGLALTADVANLTDSQVGGGESVPGRPLLVTAWAVGAGALLIVSRVRARGQRSGSVGPAVSATGVTVRRVGFLGVAVVMLASLGVASGVGARLLTPVGRADPIGARDIVPQPVRPRQAVTPLQQFAAMRSGWLPLEFDVSTVAGDAPRRLRYVTLDRFDGQYWTTDAVYRRAGRTLPLEAGRVATRKVVERVHIVQPGPLGWVVSSGRPVEISVSDLGVNERTGDVVFPDDREIPRDYTVTSVVNAPTEAQRAAATPVPLPETERPTLPPDLVAEATEATAGAFGADALARLEAYFSSEPYTVVASQEPPTGHGIYQIERLIRKKGGTAEQYASAFAVFARALGYNARVVVGFRPRDPGERGEVRVTGRDVHAWPEVEFRDIGWIAYEPTPRSTAEPDPEPTTTPRPDTPSRTSEALPTKTAAPPADRRPDSTSPVGGWEVWSAVRYSVVGVAALAAGYAIVVPLVKRIRRSRRRRIADPQRRTIAAWREVTDRLLESGVRMQASETPREVVLAARQRLRDPRAFPERPDFDDYPDASLPALAVLHDRAAFAPTPVTDADASAAWRHADGTRGWLRDHSSLGRRVLSALDPRPLTRRIR